MKHIYIIYSTKDFRYLSYSAHSLILFNKIPKYLYVIHSLTDTPTTVTYIHDTDFAITYVYFDVFEYNQNRKNSFSSLNNQPK